MLRDVSLCHQCGASLYEGDRFCSGCGASVVVSEGNRDPLIGRTIGGAYVVLELIGVGGMGRVYRAEQRMLGRTVAIKVIHPHLLSDEQSLARFYTEARAASRLNHPNSVSIIDFGRTDDGILYLVMEYLNGKDLARLMHEDGPLPFARICDVVTGMLAALGEAHALEVIHRDLKPENVIVERMRTGTDLIKVVDFGLAKLLGGTRPSDRSITSPGLVCGTPDYMSPEQGRGEDVDARGDIYAVGVVLFELLTETLPFIADTPTNVVLRHIQDPVPDPRDIAPHRHIPVTLVEVVMKALAKKPADRFQNAEEMSVALRRAAGSLQPPNSEEITCTACSARSPSSKRFCGECGAPLAARVPTPSPRMTVPPRLSTPPAQRRPLVGRVKELKRIDELRGELAHGLRAVCVVGEPGVGKTRLLAEVSLRATGDRQLVVIAGPHDSGAPVAYSAIRGLLATLFGVDEAHLSQVFEAEGAALDALARAGVEEVISPTGLAGAIGRARVGAVAAALGAALDVALARERAPSAVLIVDDLDRCDGLTQRVLCVLADYVPRNAFLLVACQRPRPGAVPPITEVLSLAGLTSREARCFMARTPTAYDDANASPSGQVWLPFYLDQIQSLGFAIEGEDRLPPRLADAVLQHVEQLNVGARRLLQAAAVLGDRCFRDDLAALSESPNLESLDQLAKQGLAMIDENRIYVTHPFLRMLVEASIPAQARKELHRRALELATRKKEPLEVRAQHASQAGESFSALMLLERMGNVALSRGDSDTAIFGYQRGLEIARAEALETGDLSLDDAIATFSRKLGSALVQRGDIAGGEGVLREALELTRPGSVQRARMLLGLGEVVTARKRVSDAHRYLGQALEIAVQLKDVMCQGDVHVSRAALQRSEGDIAAAVASQKAALALYQSAPGNDVERVLCAVELASLEIERQDWNGAREHLKDARALAQQAKAVDLVARVVGLSATIDIRQGKAERAMDGFREAIRLASEAGDAHAVNEWRSRMHDVQSGPTVMGAKAQ